MRPTDDGFPLLDGPSIPWPVAEKAFTLYRAKHGGTLEELATRGGFLTIELDMFHPGWRSEAEEIPRLRTALAKAKAVLTVARQRLIEHHEELGAICFICTRPDNVLIMILEVLTLIRRAETKQL